MVIWGGGSIVHQHRGQQLRGRRGKNGRMVKRSIEETRTKSNFIVVLQSQSPCSLPLLLQLGTLWNQSLQFALEESKEIAISCLLFACSAAFTLHRYIFCIKCDYHKKIANEWIRIVVLLKLLCKRQNDHHCNIYLDTDCPPPPPPPWSGIVGEIPMDS